MNFFIPHLPSVKFFKELEKNSLFFLLCRHPSTLTFSFTDRRQAGRQTPPPPHYAVCIAHTRLPPQAAGPSESGHAFSESHRWLEDPETLCFQTSVLLPLSLILIFHFLTNFFASSHPWDDEKGEGISCPSFSPCFFFYLLFIEA